MQWVRNVGSSLKVGGYMGAEILVYAGCLFGGVGVAGFVYKGEAALEDKS